MDVAERLWRRAQLMFGRGRIKTGNDTGPVQILQVQLSPLELKDLMRAAEYGFASNPLPGCHAIAVFVGGDRSNGVIVATNDQLHRLKNLQPGEAAIYDDQGQSVWIKRGGIEVNCAGNPLTIVNASSVTHDGVNIGNTHTHSDPQGGTVGPPS